MNQRKVIFTSGSLILASSLFFITAFRPGLPDDKKGAYEYKDFEKAAKCRTCHVQFYEQWSQSMMAQAYTHHW
ncbi:MAG: hypothetical protein HGA23_05620, partial [Bacteroidales bacterium]|nr:hypothetical protein [Bacteroidales bacterium]